MPLLPEMRAFLDRLPPPGDGPTSVRELRAAVEERSAQLPRRATDIAGTTDLTLPGPATALPARLYRPRGAGPFPLVVFFHGGGFVAYSIETHDGVCRELCDATGALVLSVGYRLAPETRFPGAVDDAVTALRWAREHAPLWQADPARMAVAGDSAGANLAIACTRAERGTGAPALRAQLLFYPATNIGGPPTASHDQNAEGHFLTAERMRLFNRSYLSSPDDAADPRVSPLRADDVAGLPPLFLATAEFDPLRDDGRAYADKLHAAGVDVTYRNGDGLIHGFANLVGFSPEAGTLLDEATAWLRDRLV